MRLASELKVGDKVIYLGDLDIRESVVVDRPIDDGIARPLFKIGRVDFADGGYVTCGTKVYDSYDEAKEVLIERIKDIISEQERIRNIADSTIALSNIRLKQLING